MISLTEFIKRNRALIDEAILSVVPNNKLNDTERRLWVLNDEGLYLWAKSQRVRV